MLINCILIESTPRDQSLKFKTIIYSLCPLCPLCPLYSFHSIYSLHPLLSLRWCFIQIWYYSAPVFNEEIIRFVVPNIACVHQRCAIWMLPLSGIGVGFICSGWQGRIEVESALLVEKICGLVVWYKIHVICDVFILCYYYWLVSLWRYLFRCFVCVGSGSGCGCGCGC